MLNQFEEILKQELTKSLKRKLMVLFWLSFGISRLGVDTKHSLLSKDEFLPSPGQGALAIICRSDDSENN